MLVALKLDEEDVLERLHQARSAVDAGQVQVEGLEATEDIGQCARRGVRYGEGDKGLASRLGDGFLYVIPVAGDRGIGSDD